MGVTSALVFCNLGASYGTAKSGVGICSMGVLKPELIFKSLIPIIMAGILGIYGLIVAVILQGKSKCHFLFSKTPENFTLTPLFSWTHGLDRHHQCNLR
jgi:ATP synthase proteolipid subunit